VVGGKAPSKVTVWAVVVEAVGIYPEFIDPFFGRIRPDDIFTRANFAFRGSSCDLLLTGGAVVRSTGKLLLLDRSFTENIDDDELLRLWLSVAIS